GVVFSLFFKEYFFQTIVVNSSSMEPALPLGSTAFIDKITLSYRAPQRGDIVVFRAPDSSRQSMGKRIIAVGGDEVRIEDKKVYLNGNLLTEHYIVHRHPKKSLMGESVPLLKIPSGTVFVLGDNRDESEDSSYWWSKGENPFVSIDLIQGLVRRWGGKSARKQVEP
ncbi:MAG: signal peptidase I, partial [Elusimicrobia bacterium]|nr:signal peptidase I [Elusimicrobiota bacterium]